jgi:hypothetical protein
VVSCSLSLPEVTSGMKHCIPAVEPPRCPPKLKFGHKDDDALPGKALRQTVADLDKEVAELLDLQRFHRFIQAVCDAESVLS